METEEYLFEGVEGIPYFSATVPATARNDSYKTSMSDSAISDGHVNLNYGDETNSTTMEGTIYISPTRKERTYYYNPVCQSTDGSVYITSGSSFMVGDWTASEGEQFSQAMDAAYTITENGRTKTESVSVTLSISVMFAPETIVILQMDTYGGLLSRMKYTPGELPEKFSPEPDTAYLVVETHKRDATGNITIAWDIYGNESESIETFFARADGVCVKHRAQIMWPEY